MAKADFWSIHRVRVRFNESDPQGLAHNSMNLIWFGVGLNEYFRELGFDRYAMGARDKTRLHVVKASLEYNSPIRLDEELDICTRVSKVGRTSVTFTYELYAVNDGRLVGSGDQVWVNTSTETHRGWPWPEDFLEVLRTREPALEEAQPEKP